MTFHITKLEYSKSADDRGSDTVRITATFADNKLSIIKAVNSMFKCPYRIGQSIEVTMDNPALGV